MPRTRCDLGFLALALALALVAFARGAWAETPLQKGTAAVVEIEADLERIRVPAETDQRARGTTAQAIERIMTKLQRLTGDRDGLAAVGAGCPGRAAVETERQRATTQATNLYNKLNALKGDISGGRNAGGWSRRLDECQADADRLTRAVTDTVADAVRRAKQSASGDHATRARTFADAKRTLAASNEAVPRILAELGRLQDRGNALLGEHDEIVDEIETLNETPASRLGGDDAKGDRIAAKRRELAAKDAEIDAVDGQIEAKNAELARARAAADRDRRTIDGMAGELAEYASGAGCWERQ